MQGSTMPNTATASAQVLLLILLLLGINEQCHNQLPGIAFAFAKCSQQLAANDVMNHAAVPAEGIRSGGTKVFGEGLVGPASAL